VSAGSAGATAKRSPGLLLASLDDVSGLFNEAALRQFGMGSHESSSAKALASLLSAFSSGQASSQACSSVSLFDCGSNSAAVSSADVKAVTAATATSSSELVHSRGKHCVVKLVQPPGRPDLSLFFKAASASFASFRPARVVYLDSCSDNSFLKRMFCELMGIRVARMSGSTMHMSTVCGVVSKPLVVTEPVHLLLGKGTAHEHFVVGNFVVLDDDSLPYDVIIGTPLLRILGCAIDFVTNQLTVRPRWWLHDDTVTSFTLPISAAEPYGPSAKPALTFEPAVASPQAVLGASSHFVSCAAGDDVCTDSGVIDFLEKAHPVLQGV
jgi:hypothetical protein